MHDVCLTNVVFTDCVNAKKKSAMVLVHLVPISAITKTEQSKIPQLTTNQTVLCYLPRHKWKINTGNCHFPLGNRNSIIFQTSFQVNRINLFHK